MKRIRTELITFNAEYQKNTNFTKPFLEMLKLAGYISIDNVGKLDSQLFWIKCCKVYLEDNEMQHFSTLVKVLAIGSQK